MKIRTDDGTGLDLKYLVKDTDRHGNVRIYVRRHGRKVRIRDLANVEEFMTGSAPAPPSSRVLATVLFTDLVDSTRRAAQRRPEVSIIQAASGSAMRKLL